MDLLMSAACTRLSPKRGSQREVSAAGDAVLLASSDSTPRLPIGGPAGWPAGEATFTYKRSSTDIGHAVLSKPYSIGYMGHYQASTFGLSIFSIIQVIRLPRLLPVAVFWSWEV